MAMADRLERSRADGEETERDVEVERAQDRDRRGAVVNVITSAYCITQSTQRLVSHQCGFRERQKQQQHEKGGGGEGRVSLPPCQMECRYQDGIPLWVEVHRK